MRTYFPKKKMKANRDFQIDIYGLKNGTHEYEFEFSPKLFENFENRLIDSGSGICRVELIKKETMMELNFSIEGSFELTCDRSTEKFDYPIRLSEHLIIKYGHEFDDSRDDYWVIPDTEQSINVEQVLYEYLTLAVPMKKLHPRFAEQEEDDEEEEWVYSSEDIEEEEEIEDNEVDPRWNALKNIKNLN